MYSAMYTSPLGSMLLCATDAGVCLAVFIGQAHFDDSLALLTRQYGAMRDEVNPHLELAIGQLDEYFAGTRHVFTVSLVISGTPFQQTARRALRHIPYGQTVSYREQARLTASPRAIRATASANARNTLAILLPCHRVVASDGTLSGYAGGIERKKWLIDHEKRHA